jgi:hypothetical protein
LLETVHGIALGRAFVFFAWVISRLQRAYVRLEVDLWMPGRGVLGTIQDVCRPKQEIFTSKLALGWPRRRRKKRKMHAY